MFLQGFARGNGVEEELAALFGVGVVFVVAAVGVEVVRVGAEGGEAFGLGRRGRSLAVRTLRVRGGGGGSLPGRTIRRGRSLAVRTLAGARAGHGVGILVEVALLGGGGRIVLALGVDGALGGILEFEDGIHVDFLPDQLAQRLDGRLQQPQRLLHLRREGHRLRLALLLVEGEGHDE